MKSIFKFFILASLFIFPFANSFSQEIKLVVKTKNSENQSIIDAINYKKKHLSKKNALIEIDSISKKLLSLGFINNQFKTIEKDLSLICSFSLHQKIEIVRVYFEPNSLNNDLLNKISISFTDSFFNSPLHLLENSLNQIVEYYENEGRSFTSVSLSDIIQNEDILSANLIVKLSSKREINTIIIKGYSEFPKKYIEQHLNLKKNKTFNLERLEALNKTINTIPFITQIKKPEVLFTKDSTSLYIYVKKKSTSSFDGIIGFSNDIDSKKLKFNGYLDLKLNNILNKGETLNINWENSQNKNSTLNINFNSPYIFNSKFNLNAYFDIFRQDTLYVNTKAEAKIGYTINKNNFIDLIAFTEKSDATSDLTSTIENFKKNVFGLAYTFKLNENYDYFNNYKFLIEAGYLLGNRSSENLNTHQNSIDFLTYYYAHLNTRNLIFIKTKTQILNITNPLENELYRIGGVNSIRGFNENSILTKRYNVTNLEYHYKLNLNSFLYTITDFAIIHNATKDTSEQLYGLGLGFHLNTTHTILDLSYALGKNYNTPFNFNDSKLHIRITYPF